MNSININDMATSEYKKYSYASEQDYITVTNTGTSDLMFDVGKYTNIVLHPSQTWANEVGFKEFQIKSLGIPCIFTAELREYGNDYVTSAQLAEIAKYLTTPVATYTHNTNKSVAVSAVDIATNRFTSVGHTLVNGDTVYPILNTNAGNVYLIDKLPGGIANVDYPGYYVKKIDADTFELYTDSGLTTIVDVTANANIDLSKWHFETSGPSTINITNIPNLLKCKLLVRGRNLRKNTGGGILMVNGIGAVADFITTAGTAFNQNAMFSTCGDVSLDISCEIDYEGILTMRYKGIGIMSNTAVANTVTATDKVYKSPKYLNGTILSIQLINAYLANGTVVEVYKL